MPNSIKIYNEKEIVIPDLSPLINLERLSISMVQNIEYENLKTCNNIESLEFRLVPINDLKFLINYKCLKTLNLFSTYVKDLTPLLSQSKLEELRFCKHNLDTEIRINDYKQINLLGNLRVLHIGQDITHINSLENLNKLEEFSYWKLDKLDFISELPRIKKIFVMGNLNSDFKIIKGIAKLKHLEYLDVSYSRIKDLSSLNNSELKKLILKDTPLDYEYKKVFRRILGKTEIQRFKKNNPNCEVNLV